MLRRHRADLNQREITHDLRAIGASVKVVSGVDFFCDLIVGYRAVNYLLEVKSKNGKLRESQKEFIADWKGGEIIVARSLEDFLKHIQGIK